MCGLVGILDRSGNAEQWTRQIAAASDAIVHRGPDDDGMLVEGPVGFGFRRLSILDLSPAGHQPMESANREWAVVFNGEIYNFLELRAELQSSGSAFRSDGDSEVLVEALAVWGVKCFERFNGMWAVLAWHRPSHTLYACRDPWGIKPLFMTDQPTYLAFSSEIKVLRAFGAELGTANAIAARRFLDEGSLDVDETTLYTNVVRLRPGLLYRYAEGRALPPVQFGDGTEFVDVPRITNDAAGEATYVDAFRSAFLGAVRLRLRADVDIGTCLSGGLDSTAIACAAAKMLSGERLTACRHAFTALMPEFDESRTIRAVIQQTGAKWHVTAAGDQLIRDHMLDFFQAHDEPVHSLSALAGYLVMGLASTSGVRVLLNGQGADELLAGYSSTTLPFLRSLLAQESALYSARQAWAEAGNVSDAAQLLARAQVGRFARGLPLVAEAAQRHLGRMFELQSDTLVARTGPLGQKPPSVRVRSPLLQDALDDQVRSSPLPLYLRIEDSNSSAWSIEARLPFLDPTVVALARAAPTRLLRRDGFNKYLLRRILPGLVPDIVWRRVEKMGFPVASSRWLRGPMRDLFADTMSESLARRSWSGWSPRRSLASLQSRR